MDFPDDQPAQKGKEAQTETGGRSQTAAGLFRTGTAQTAGRKQQRQQRRTPETAAGWQPNRQRQRGSQKTSAEKKITYGAAESAPLVWHKWEKKR